MPHATTQQILDAFQALTDAELLALRKYASQKIGGTSFSEPLDLIHEALHRALDGRRNWPTHVNFGLFLAMSMRSIGDAERKRHENKFASPMSLEDMEQAGHAIGSIWSVEDELIASEDMHVAKKTATLARAALEGDNEALRVLGGLLAGMSPKEMCESFSMNPKAFDSARHRVMRRLKSCAGPLH